MRLKKWIVSVMACMLAMPMMAQLGEERHNLSVGVNAGMNMNTVVFEPSIKQDSHMGIHQL